MRQKAAGTRQPHEVKRQVGCCSVTFLWGWQGSVRQVTSLVLTRPFLIDRFKVALTRKPKL